MYVWGSGIESVQASEITVTDLAAHIADTIEGSTFQDTSKFYSKRSSLLKGINLSQEQMDTIYTIHLRYQSQYEQIRREGGGSKVVFARMFAVGDRSAQEVRKHLTQSQQELFDKNVADARVLREKIKNESIALEEKNKSK